MNAVFASYRVCLRRYAAHKIAISPIHISFKSLCSNSSKYYPSTGDYIRPRRRKYDAIVIGAGHNGLITAAYLSKAGYKVLVLERRHLVGGAGIIPLYMTCRRLVINCNQILSSLKL